MIKIICDGCDVEILDKNSSVLIRIVREDQELFNKIVHLCHYCSNSLISNIDPRKWARPERAEG